MALFAALLPLCGCLSADGAGKAAGYVTVSLVDGAYYAAEENTFTVRRGADVTFHLSFIGGASFRSCSFADYSVYESGEGATLVLHGVNYPERVTVQTMFADATIHYNLNGGSFLSGEGDSYFKSYQLVNHVRANTEIGTDVIAREGYILTGWNTEPDASGTHIGLGSRVTVEGTAALELYAEWEACLPDACFTYEIEGDGVALTGYTGAPDVEKFVLPRQIEGLPVTSVRKNFAVGVKGTSLVLPDTLYAVAPLAFRDCSFEEITFSDNLREVDDSSFWGFGFKTWHINAVLAPCYQASSEHVQFADDIDHLILSAGQKKLLFYAGCSMSYGLNSAAIAQRYGDTRVLNLGVIGGIDAGFQFEIITQYVEEGDVFVHAPEVGSEYQLMARRDVDSRFFVMTEGNYDLLSLVDMTKIPDAFLVFAGYNNNRSLLEGGSYEESTFLYNSYGDMAKPRPYTGEVRGDADDSYTYDIAAADQTAVGVLCDLYDALRARGCTVYFSFSPVNINGLSAESRLSRVWEQFEEIFRTGLAARGYAVVSRAEDYLFTGDYFYDTDYHLNDEGVVLRTRQLLEDLEGL